MQKKLANILLIGPYNPHRIRTGQYLSPSLGLHRIESYLKNNRLANVVVSDPTLNYRNTATKLGEKRWDIIGHSILHPTLEYDLELIYDANKISPTSLQIAGGQGAVFNAELLLKKTSIKAVAQRFGEMPMKQIAGGDPLLDVLGLYLLETGKVVSTDKPAKITLEKFKEISMGMNFGDIPYEEYWNFMKSQYDMQHVKTMNNEGMLKTIRLMVSNYCPMGCTHCTSTEFLKGERLSFLEPKEIITMMEQAVVAHPETEAFYFNDDNFLLLGKEKIDEFCTKTRTLDKKYNLMFQGRVDEVNKETLNEMAKANFKIAFYGVETFSDRLAGDIRKRRGKISYEAIARQTIEDTLNAGITAQFSLMLFTPSSQQEDLEKTIENTVDLMGKGAKVTIFPYIEAYSGAKIVGEDHEISYNEFDINDEHFRIPQLVLPDNKDIRKLAKESLILKEDLNAELTFKKFGGKIPQPVDSLNLFRAVYDLLGKNTSKIERELKNF